MYGSRVTINEISGKVEEQKMESILPVYIFTFITPFFTNIVDDNRHQTLEFRSVENLSMKPSTQEMVRISRL
jgi:hypothetical protein